MLDPKEIEIDGKSYILTKFNALDGIEISAHVPLSAPVIGDIQKCLKVIPKIMKYVYVPIKDGIPIALSTDALITNHTTTDYPTETLLKLIAKMVEHNFSFFGNGRALTFFDGIAQKGKQWTTKTLTDLLEQLYQKVKQLSES